MVNLNLVTGLNTAAAEDTAREIPDDEGIAGLSWISDRAFRKPDRLNLISIGQLLEAAVTICLTGKTAMGTGGEKKFYINLPGLYHPL
jgi:hypothetical protein